MTKIQLFLHSAHAHTHTHRAWQKSAHTKPQLKRIQTQTSNVCRPKHCTSRASVSVPTGWCFALCGFSGCGLAQSWSWPKEEHGRNYLHEARSVQLRLASGQSATTLGGVDAEVDGDAQGALVRRPQTSYRTRHRLTGTDAVAILKDAVQYRCDARRDRDSIYA